MAKIERGGLRLVVENFEQFTRQVGDASTTMGDFGKSAQATASQVNSSSSEFRGSSVVIEQWSETVEDGSSAALAASDSFILFGAALTAVSAKASELVIGMTLTASRIKELELLLETTRQNAVYTAEAEGDMAKAAHLSASAVQEQVEGIRALHLSGRVANETVASLIRYNLDYTKATELATLAQDAATFAAQDSSQALDGLIHGITTLQPRVLRSYGIMVNLNEAYRDFAHENNLVATDLTQAQRQQAAFNAVLAQAPSIAGAYEAALGSATKQIRSVYTDTVNLAEAYGEFLEPAVAGIVGTFRGFLQVLTELPAPIRALATGVSAGGAATLTLTAGTATAISALLRMKTALSGLSGVALTASSALLGIGGAFTVVLTAAIALTSYVKEQERAQDELEASILSSTDSYEDYTQKMEDAGFAQNILAEAIWETVHAKEAEAQIDAARAYIEAQNAAENLVRTLDQIPAGADAMQLLASGLDNIASNDKLAQVFAEDDKFLQQLIESSATFAGYAADDANAVVDAWQLVAQALQTTATLAEQQEAVDFIEDLKTQMDLTGKEGVQMEIILNAVIKAIQGLGSALGSTSNDMYEYTEQLNEAFMSTLTKEWMRERTQNLYDFTDSVNEAMDKSAQSMIDATTRRNRALEDLDTEYQNKAEDAWRDYQRDLQETEGNLAAFHAGTLDELLDLDRDYLQDRNDAWRQYQQDLADAERDLQQDLEDASRDRSQKLSDLDAEYARDKEDALRELNQDLQDEAEEHADKLEEIERNRQEDMLGLEQEYQDKLFNIQNLAQQRREELQDKLAERESDLSISYAMKALELYRDAGMRVTEELRDMLFRSFSSQRTGIDVTAIAPGLLELYEEYIRDFAELDDQRWADEQDLTDDVAREQEQRGEDLEAWLAEEQAAIEEAYAERIAAENEKFAEEQEARREDYDRKLEDLQRAHGREQEEIELNYRRRLDDLRIQAQRERDEAALAYQRRLEDIEIEYNRERELIKSKLEEQNEAARQKYNEALEDLAIAKKRERDEINLQYDRTITDANAKLDQMVREAGEKYGLLPETLKPAYRIIKDDLHALLFGDADSLANQWQGFIDYLFNNILQARSPSRVMMKAAESMYAGLEKGMGGQNIGDMLTAGFDAAALQSNIQAALPASMSMVPGGMGSSSVSNTTTNNLTVQAQYAHQGEGSLRDDLSLFSMMMGAWG